MTTKKTPRLAGRGRRVAFLEWMGREHTGNTARSQRERIRQALHALGSITTLECSRHLSIVHPPRRVMELRREGMPILLTWQVDSDEQGNFHRVGRYVLAGAGGAICGT